MLDDITNWILAAGALGAAAFGFVETLKAQGWIGLAGIEQLRAALAGPGNGILLELLRRVYGEEQFEALLTATYRRGPTDTSEFLRNGLRLAISGVLTDEERGRAARALGQDPEAMWLAYQALASATPEEKWEADVLAQRKIIGQAELVIDARVDAGVCYADTVLAARKRLVAGAFAILASLLVTVLGEGLYSSDAFKQAHKALAHALLTGIVAVPFAPIAKDLVSLLQSARDALRSRST